MIYLASPLFNPIEREFNLRLKRLIRLPVYVPQEDGLLLVDVVAAGADPLVAAHKIYKEDIEALKRSSLLIAVLNGPHVDSGVAFEIGYFAALGKPVLGFHNDSRSELRTGFNPMIESALCDLVASEDELVAKVSQLCAASIRP